MKKTEDFKALMDLATVRLYRGIDQQTTPTGARCGFIIQRNNRMIAITAAHKSHVDDHWFVDMNINKGKSSVHAPLNGLTHWWKANLDNDNPPEQLDIAWAQIDWDAFTSQLISEGWDPKEPVPIFPYVGPVEPPKKNVPYGFHAQSAVQMDANLGLIFPVHATETNLRYSHFDPKRNAYVFDLGKTHPGHAYYEGASGCPIADEHGQIVSILLGGDTSRNILWGAKLTDYDHMWDVDFH